jgi:hypothetical protein
MKKSMLDDDGVDFLGMRLAIVLIVAALLISAAAVYVDGYLREASREKARHEASRITALAGAEYASGCPGSAAGISISIPRGVRRVSFGVEGLPQAYSLEFDDGGLETYAADCPFMPVILYPGDYALALEVVEGNGSYAISVRGA